MKLLELAGVAVGTVEVQTLVAADRDELLLACANRSTAGAVVVPMRLLGSPSDPDPGLSGNSTLDPGCRARLADAARAVNVLFYVPLDRTCDGSCLMELETLEPLRAQTPCDALEIFVILSRADLGQGADSRTDERIERRKLTLPAYVTAVVDDGTCPIPLGRKVVDLGLAPVKIIADRDFNIVRAGVPG